MPTLKIHIDAKDMLRVSNAIAKTGLDARPIFSKALNDAGKQSMTVLKRKLAKQTSIPVNRVADHMSEWRSSPANLQYKINIRHKRLRITPGNYSAVQLKAGVRYKGWGKKRRRETAEGTFILRANGGQVAMVREDGKIRPMYGASIPRELEINKVENEAAVNAKFNEKFVPRVLYQLEKSLKKAGRETRGNLKSAAGSLRGVTGGFQL